MRERLERENLTVLAYRFAGDRFCRAERFTAYAAALGDRFIGRVLPDSAANVDVAPFFSERVACAHSVVTAHLIDAAGQPTIAAPTRSWRSSGNASFNASRPRSAAEAGAHEGACLGDGAAARLEPRVPDRPGMDHFGPDLERDRDAGGARDRGVASGVVEQRLRRADLNEHGGKAAGIAEERRDPRILPVHVRWQIGIDELGEIAAMD